MVRIYIYLVNAIQNKNQEEHMNQGISIKQILREKEMADSISEKCELVLQQHGVIQERDTEIGALKQEIEKLKKANTDLHSKIPVKKTKKEA